MKLSQLKTLVDEAVAQAAKHKIDPEVAFFSKHEDDDRDHLRTVEFAEISSAGNIIFQAHDLRHDIEVTMTPDSRAVFVLSDDPEAIN